MMSNEIHRNSSFSLKSILEKDKLNNSNLMDWYSNMKFVLRAENKMYVLEGPIPEEPATTTGISCKTWEKHVDDSIKVSCLMLASMIPELQQNLVDQPAYDMVRKLEEMFQQQARHEHFCHTPTDGGNVGAGHVDCS
ncbi:hypothetical protein L1987_07128 [Smallanthus sonchifolius]|uniref:Uncharacterized protein n=1 Tax=Smallanthus sonchifolius TaxID=185202 RepID=A0ACB9K064_9ASTR|nr:hypothetical protein L1987_07128 [Smallanthus sonchifolius]